MWDRSDILARFGSLQVWLRAGERAPHKPLLALYALGRAVRGDDRLIPFSRIEEPLKRLLRDFGPVRKVLHPEYPFWRLRNDGVWEVLCDESALEPGGDAAPSRGELIRRSARGGFVQEIYDAVRREPGLASEVAHLLLNAHFPDSVHEDLLFATGLDGSQPIPRRGRDPAFRARVLTAYDRRCAICGFDVRLGDV